MSLHLGWHPFPGTILLLAISIFTASCAAEYVPKTITDTPGYTLLAGVSHVPEPIVVSPNEQDWAGIDGAWNTFSLRVGSQQRNTSVLVSTRNQQVWVVNAQACSSIAMVNLTHVVSTMPKQQCESSRGYLFNTSESTTFQETGYFSLQNPLALDDRMIGLYGLETVSLGSPGNGEGPTVNGTFIGTIGTYNTLATPEFWLGYIGLQSQAKTFFQEPSHPSYITALFEAQGIPSQSFGYSAGANYRHTEATSLGSLTLGGYDASCIVSNDMIFTPNTDGNLMVDLVGLVARTTSASDIDLLNGTNVNMNIDSTIAEIWLPIAVCKIFEDAFGLIYDEVTDLYLVDDISHRILMGLNPNVTFTLRPTTKSDTARTVQIVLPYAAFDLQASSPYQGLNKTQRYFPIRRGTNESQWTLGRTFFQEAYLKVDWERSQFGLYQRDWTDRQSDIAAIVSPRYGKATGAEDLDRASSKLSTGAIVGIAVGAVIVVLIAATTAWWIWQRQRRQKQPDYSFVAAATTLSKHPEDSAFADVVGGPLVFQKSELPGESNITKNNDPFADAEAIEQPIYEMMGDFPAAHEAGGRQLSEKESMIVRERTINGVDPNGTPILPAFHAAGRSATLTISDIVILNGTDHHRRASFSSRAAQHEGCPDLPPYTAQQGPSHTEDHVRRRFSYES
jgi:hypothetical protein